ncbi:hypothetical protein ABQF26_04450 [Mycolicibacterium elephantis]
MRDRDTIDAEPRLIAAVRLAAADIGAPVPSIVPAHRLLDELLSVGGQADRLSGHQ